MTNRESQVKKETYMFSLGGGLLWASEKRYAQEMQLTVPVFRRLCKALKVPMVELPGTERIVSVPMFTLAMFSVSRIGRPDFLVPGCSTLRRARKWRRGAVSELDPGELESSFEECIRELAALRRLKGRTTEMESVDVAREAARRMVEAHALLAPQTQAEEAEAA
jgi:hypothetical protein